MELKTLKEKVESRGLTVKDGSFIEFDKDTPDFRILPNFHLSELLTKDQSGKRFTRLDLNVLIVLQKIRDEFKSPVGVSSSYRSKKYNQSQNGATSSQHILGKALDIYPINRNILSFKETIKRVVKTGGRGLTYASFVHIDTGRTRTW